MDRRDFLKKAGQGGLALASAPALTHVLSRVALAGGQSTNFHFVCISGADTIDGVQHWLAMVGDGTVTPGGIVASGSFNHFNQAGPIPRPLLGTGTWKAKSLVSFSQIGTWGGLAAGSVVAEIHLVPEGGTPIAATLVVDCNLGFAGLSTGRPEGITLTIPGAPMGPFEPFVPALGLTVLTTGNENRD